MSPLIIADTWMKEIALSQGINYDRVSRIIIDAKVGEPVFMYITQYGDDGVLKLTPPEVVPPEVESLHLHDCTLPGDHEGDCA